MTPSHRPWFILACVAVGGALVIGAVATRYELVGMAGGSIGPRAYLLDRWTGTARWLFNSQAVTVHEQFDVESATPVDGAASALPR